MYPLHSQSAFLTLVQFTPTLLIHERKEAKGINKLISLILFISQPRMLSCCYFLINGERFSTVRCFEVQKLFLNCKIVLQIAGCYRLKIFNNR